MAKPPKSAQFGQFWRLGRAWIGQPSEGHENSKFLGINSWSTYKKVSKNAKFVTVLVYQHYYVLWDEVFNIVFVLFLIILGKSDERITYRLGLGNSFAVVYIAVTCLVQELY